MTFKPLGYIVGGVILLAILGCFFLGQAPGVKLVLTNSSADSIANVRLVYTGGEYNLSSLPAKATHSFRVNPKAESHLVLSFVDAKQYHHEKLIDVYLEPGYKGEIEIWVDKTNDVTWKNKVSL